MPGIPPPPVSGWSCAKSKINEVALAESGEYPRGRKRKVFVFESELEAVAEVPSPFTSTERLHPVMFASTSSPIVPSVVMVPVATPPARVLLILYVISAA
ncbi:MAG: hypothetical protein ACJAXW_004509 [Candidatus Azotimanducaceae bacterium]|jgi:hypothetical protein